MRTHLVIAAAWLGTAFSILGSPASAAADGEALDPSFGSNGTARTALGFPGSGSDFIQSLALQPDGKILAAGAKDTPNYQTGGVSTSALARYLPNGELDATFASGGVFTSDPAGPTRFDRFSSVLVQPDGKPVVAGGSNFLLGPLRFVAQRLTADGSPDPGFSGDGMQVINPSPTVSGPYGWGVSNVPDAVLASDGDLIMAGTGNYETPDSVYNNIAVVRLDSAGTPDPGFGSGGIVNTPMPLPSGFQEGTSAGAMALQPDGRIVIGGFANDSNYDFVGILIRLMPNGTIDSSFGAGGVQVVPSMLWVASLTVASDGRIIAAGRDSNPEAVQSDFAVSRFNSNGSLDSTFSSDGSISIDFEDDSYGFFPQSAESVVELPNGKIVVAGSGNGFAVARLTSSGELDSARALFPGESSGSVPTALSMVVQPDGKPILGGFESIPGNADGFALKRVESLGAPDPPPDDPTDPPPDDRTNRPPETKITKIKVDSKKRRVQITFRGTDDGGPVASFQCRLEKSGRFRNCKSPYKKSNLKRGRHELQVRAVDGAGKVDLSPAKARFTIKKKAKKR